MRKLLVALTILLSLVGPRLVFAAASTFEPVTKPFGVDSSGLTESASQGYNGGTAIDSTNFNIATFIGKFIIAPLLGIMGLIFFCLMVYAGFLWMTSVGNEKKVTKAKDIMTSAVIGAVLVVTAYGVSSAVINGLTCGDITTSSCP